MGATVNKRAWGTPHMANHTLTLTLDGDISLATFRAAITHFEELVGALTAEVAGQPIDWWLDDLQVGSASATIVGRAASDEPVQRVVAAYETIGEALQHGDTMPYSPRVKRAVAALTQQVTGSVTALRLETAHADYALLTNDASAQWVQPQARAWGVLAGRVQALSSRHALRFTLYDALFDRAVACYLRDDQADLMLDIWGQKVQVAGYITRDPATGRAIAIRDISHIDILPPPTAESYKLARGVLAPASEPAEVSIRRIRDADD